MKIIREIKLCSYALLATLLLWPAPAPAQTLAEASDPTITTTKKESAKETDKAGKTDKKADKPASKTTATKQGPDSPGLFKQMKYTFELGGQFTNVSGARPSKFEEFRQVRDGFLFRRLKVVANPEASPAFFRFIGRGPGELDQRYLLDFGKYGDFRTTVEWAGLPHLYTAGARSLYSSTTPGVLTIPDQIQQTLQNTPNADLPAAVRGFVASAPLVSLQVKRQTLKAEQRVHLTEHWSAHLRFMNQRKFGSKPLGTGSYERIGIATGDTFRVIAAELPEQVNYRHNQVTLGTSYTRAKWAVNFDYTYSKFDNRIASLTFDNPFRATDLQATGSGGVFDRAAFSRGIFALPPDNQSNSFLVSGFVDLPHNSRWASALGWSFWRQNEAFVPYTLNSAVVATGLPAGTSITDTKALPRPSLEGAVDIFTQDHVFATQLSKRWTANLHYRSYLNDNQTPEILFPGYAAFGESYWRPNINGKLIENEPLTFRRQTATAEATWNLAKPVNWRFDYKWEGWNRRNRQAGRTNEHSVGTEISYRHSNALSGKLDYHYSDRTPQTYDPGVLEYKLLRLFDQSKRLRQNVNMQWQYHVKPELGIAGTFSYRGDDFDQNFFGLTKYVQGGGSVDLLYTALENTTLYANYSRDRYSSSLNQIAKTAVPFDLNNRWNRDERDVVDSFGAGVTTYLAKEKLFLDLHYALAFGNTRLNTVNPGTPLAGSALNATAFPFPDAKTRFQEVNLDLSYQFTPQVALGVRYLYEPYRLNDYAWDGLSPYPNDALPASQDGRRFLLLDSRYSGHDANTLGIYLRLTR
ncbi:MAG: MtrB/PioB family decaheme-associated outer membrane protein [Acidobacteria bacterium]|nr:MtrB/PioB family decaheme-associated outer membrane protein [Acidobacteriota bacterium]MBI3422616.1 MtrB/PioB family decaheme-associated outer membrane protein [Acidobacteriota bacterium]